MRTRRQGFTLMELVIVLAIIAVVSAVMVPRMRPNPESQLDQWSRHLAQDLDRARSRALAANAMTRAAISDTAWTLYLDDNRDSVFAESVAERDALGPFAERRFKDGVQLGRGSAPALPSDLGPALPAGATARLTFGPRGTTEPFGAASVIYLTSVHRTTSVRAIEINAAASVRVWKWQDGSWQ
jgi:type II secretion system protein H